MILSMISTRRPDQTVNARLTWWAVGKGTHVIAEVRFDPHGPLTAREAALEVLERLRAALEV